MSRFSSRHHLHSIRLRSVSLCNPLPASISRTSSPLHTFHLLPCPLFPHRLVTHCYRLVSPYRFLSPSIHDLPPFRLLRWLFSPSLSFPSPRICLQHLFLLNSQHAPSFLRIFSHFSLCL